MPDASGAGPCLRIAGLPGGIRGCGRAPSERAPEAKQAIGGPQTVRRSGTHRLELYGETTARVRRRWPERIPRSARSCAAGPWRAPWGSRLRLHAARLPARVSARATASTRPAHRRGRQLGQRKRLPPALRDVGGAGLVGGRQRVRPAARAAATGTERDRRSQNQQRNGSTMLASTTNAAGTTNIETLPTSRATVGTAIRSTAPVSRPRLRRESSQ